MKYNIEVAHIYTDQIFGKEQEDSLEIFKNQVKSKFENSVLTILVDDYNPKTNFLDIQGMIKKIENGGTKVDFVALESKLTQYCDKIIEKIPLQNLKHEKFDGKKVLLVRIEDKYIGLKDKDSKYSCSLLIAAWVLSRLGYFKLEDFVYKNNEKKFVADRVVNILPKKYYDSEMKVIKILEIAGFSNDISKIEYVWY